MREQVLRGMVLKSGPAGRTAIIKNRSSVRFFRSIKPKIFNLQWIDWAMVKPSDLQNRTRFYWLDNKYFEKNQWWSISFFFTGSQSFDILFSQNASPLLMRTSIDTHWDPTNNIGIWCEPQLTRFETQQKYWNTCLRKLKFRFLIELWPNVYKWNENQRYKQTLIQWL